MSSPPTPPNPTNVAVNTTPAVSVVTTDSDGGTPTQRTKRLLYSPQANLTIAIEKNKEASVNQRKKAKKSTTNSTKPRSNNVKLIRIVTKPASKDTIYPFGGIIILPDNAWAHRSVTLPVYRHRDDSIKVDFYRENPNVTRQVVKPSLDGENFYVSGTYWKEQKEIDIVVETMAFTCPTTWNNEILADYINTSLRPTWLSLLNTPSKKKTNVQPYEVPYCILKGMDVVTRPRWGDALPRYEDVVMCVRAGFQDKTMTFRQWAGADPDHIYSTCWVKGKIPRDIIRQYGLDTLSFFGGTLDEANWKAHLNGKREELPADDYEEQLKKEAQLKIDKENAESDETLEKAD